MEATTDKPPSAGAVLVEKLAAAPVVSEALSINKYHKDNVEAIRDQAAASHGFTHDMNNYSALKNYQIGMLVVGGMHHPLGRSLTSEEAAVLKQAYAICNDKLNVKQKGIYGKLYARIETSF